MQKWFSFLKNSIAMWPNSDLPFFDLSHFAQQANYDRLFLFGGLEIVNQRRPLSSTPHRRMLFIPFITSFTCTISHPLCIHSVNKNSCFHPPLHILGTPVPVFLWAGLIPCCDTISLQCWLNWMAPRQNRKKRWRLRLVTVRAGSVFW